MLVLLMGIGFILYKKSKKIHIDGMNTPIPLLLFLIFTVQILSLLTTATVEAKTVSWNWTDGGGQYYYAAGRYGYQVINIDPNTGTPNWVTALTNPSFTVSYTANNINETNGGQLVTDGATVNVGDRLRFAPKAYESRDISWFGTGGSYDSPNGDWVTNAAASHASSNDILESLGGVAAVGGFPGFTFRGTAACRPQDFVGAIPANTGGNWEIFIPLSIHPPANSIFHSGTAGLSCNGDNTVCTVTSPRTINSTFNFASTFGK